MSDDSDDGDGWRCRDCRSLNKPWIKACASFGLETEEEYRWMPISSFVIGIFVLIGSLGVSKDSPASSDFVKGSVALAVGGSALGIQNLRKRRRRYGRKVAFVHVGFGAVAIVITFKAFFAGLA